MAGPRQRDSVLAAVEVFRQARQDASITNLLAFLYICENEGLNITELARLMGATNATASRTATALEDEPGETAALIRSTVGDRHGHSRVLYLTRHGEALRDRLDGIISRASPIQIERDDNIAFV